MPIHCPITIRDVTREEFDEIDAVVMRGAYETQNKLGRLLDERVYENDFALRLRAEGCEVHTQVSLTVTSCGFMKTYWCDLIAAGVLYELKTVSALTGEHDAQILHYSMLLDISRGKLLNFRSGKVQGRLRINALSVDERKRIDFDETGWQPLSPHCETLRRRIHELTADWGAFLDVTLYDEALVHCCGGESVCGQRVPVTREGVLLGTHRIHSHAPGLCFHVTALTGDLSAHHHHLRRLLTMTALRGVQWFNFDGHRVHCITVVAMPSSSFL